jgi:hypothetical protein
MSSFMSVHEEYIARIESRAGVSIEELNSLKPREVWKKFHGDTPVSVRSFFPAVGGGGSVLHSVSKLNTDRLNSAIDALGKNIHSYF